VLVRSVLKLSQDLPDQDIVEGDVQHAADVTRTLAGADAVISALGMIDITQAATDLSDGIRMIMNQMKDMNIRRVIAVGGAGVLPHPDGGLRRDHEEPDFLQHVTAEHERTWRYLSESGKDWTLVCPVFFTDDLQNSHYRVAREALPEGSDYVMLHDLAEFIVEELDKGEFVRARVGIVSDVEG
jgi:putative NADH-flavin reductase